MLRSRDRQGAVFAFFISVLGIHGKGYRKPALHLGKLRKNAWNRGGCVLQFRNPKNGVGQCLLRE